jgi:hypothetical protein
MVSIFQWIYSLIIFINQLIIRSKATVIIATGRTTGVRFPARKIYFSLLHLVQTDPVAQSPIQGVAVVFPQGLRCRSVKLTSHLHVVPKLTMVEPYLHSPTSSQCALDWLIPATVLRGDSVRPIRRAPTALFVHNNMSCGYHSTRCTVSVARGSF